MSDPTPQPVAIGRRAGRTVGLTRTQSLIWASQRLHPEAPLANMAHRFEITGTLDADRFSDSFDAVVRRAEALRLIMPDTSRAGADATGIVVHHVPRSVEVIDIPAERVEQWCAERISTPIAVDECVYDSVLLRHADDHWTWWLDIHHLATDAWTAGLVFAATSAEYVARTDGDTSGGCASVIDERFWPVDAPVEETASEAAERAQRKADWAADAEAAGPQPPLALYGARGERTTAVTRRALRLDQPTRAALDEALAAEYRSLSRELSMLALAAMSSAITVRRLDGRDSVVVGVPVHHRSSLGARRVVGPTMELYPLVVRVDPHETHREMFARVVRSIMHLLRRARPGESPDTPFEIVLNVLTERFSTFAGIPTTTTWTRSGHVEPNHVVRLHAFDHSTDGQGGTEWQLDVNDAVAGDDSRALADHLTAEISALVHHPDALVGSGSLVGPDEAAALRLLNPRPEPLPSTAPVHEVIAERLRADPDWVVAEHAGVEITAAEFDRRAERLARHLRRQGVGSGDRVGLSMRRSIDVLVAIHGVLRAGAAFVMMSPDDPASRHDAIAADAGLALTLDRVPGWHPTDETDSDPELDSSGHPEHDTLDGEAYVLYTSGSTGQPKGVPISHRGLADYLSFAVDAYTSGDDSPPVVALHSELVFDLTITSLFLGMLTGGATIVFDQEPVEALAAIAADRRIDLVKGTPSQFELLTRLADGPMRLRTVIVGGEAFRRPVAERIAALAPGVRIFNEYGPTEAVVGCMIHEWDPALDEGADVPIGHAAPGTQLLVLDAFGQLTPPGAWGELFVRRPGMAQQYVNLPELSASRFVTLDPDLVAAGVGPAGQTGPVSGLGRLGEVRWYATGDRVRVERPGVAVYGGRSDDQVKVNGVRLEPGEVEAALVRHPKVTTALVGVWNPADVPTPTDDERCRLCGLGTDVPDTTLDDDGVCNVCRAYQAIAPQAAAWFKTEADLDDRLAAARAASSSGYDCLHLLSGGKDSTFALYQLVERGWRVHALTLDNGFISDGAKENIRRSIADLGITHEFATTDVMNEIFRDSLDRHSNVCQGCYKTIYTIAVARARAMGIPVIVTGLSRGQFFETRLIPHQFEAGRFDPDAIDRTVLEARRVYHHTPDAVTRLLPEQAVFDDDEVFEHVEFLDYYRYVDVDLAELYDFLERRAPWVRPADTGRSTNCLINVAGIQVHRAERGFHNYAEPYSWDVRLGHKTREEALEELDDIVDAHEVATLLEAVGYRPKSNAVLTAWYQSADGVDIDPDELRRHARTLLPEHAVPSAFVRIDDIPLARSAKADMASLPAPTRFHRSGSERVEPATETERRLCEIWAPILGLEAVGATDDFFDLGGASLAALEVVAAVDDEFGTDLPDAIVFRCRTVRDLAVAVDQSLADAAGSGAAGSVESDGIAPLDPSMPLPLSAGEEAMLFEYRADPSNPRYHGTRIYRVDDVLDLDLLHESFRDVTMAHQPLHTSYGPDRSPLDVDDALAFETGAESTIDEVTRFADDFKRVPFDLDAGPLVRVHAALTDDGVTLVVISLHHITADAATFDLLWEQVADRYLTGTVPELPVSYAAHAEWQRERVGTAGDFWLAQSERRAPAAALLTPRSDERDGYLPRSHALGPDDLDGGGATPFARAMAAAAATLSRFTGSESVELGITASTKDRSDVAPVVGYYLNTLPMSLRVTADGTFDDLVGACSRSVTEALPHRRFPFASMVRDARAAGHVAPSASFMLAFEALGTPTMGERDVSQTVVPSESTVADLTFFVQQRADRIDLGIEYRGTAISRRDAQLVLDVFEHCLRGGVAQPALSLNALTGPAIEHDLVGAPLTTPTESVLARLLSHVRLTPEATAVIGSDGSTSTFADLATAIDALVTRLAAAEVGRGARVGVACTRSSEMVVAAMASMWAGAIYVPLDPSVGAQRLDSIVSAARLDAILTDDVARPIGSSLPNDAARAVVDLHDTPAEATGDLDAVIDRLARRVERIDLDDAAYLIFTSGSTGRPRGVSVSHRNLGASNAARDAWFTAPPRRFLLTSSIGFDSSIVGLVWPLVTGGAVVIPGDDVVHDVDALGALVERAGVSHVLMVPSLYGALLDRRAEMLRGLDTVIVAGESCPPSVVARHDRSLPGVDLVNEYGPTEATVWSTAHRLRGGDERVLIGAPIPGARVRLVDELLRPVPAGCRGEILIAGPGVTAGYLDDPERTAERFVELDGRRWYRTGDIGHVVDGALAFVGRTDDQLNVGGNRLEPEEVEREIVEVDGVDAALVVAAVVAEGGLPTLVAHVEPATADTAAIRSHLAARLPARSVPRRIMAHERLPRNAHGKLDRAAAGALGLGAVPGAVGAADGDAAGDAVGDAVGDAAGAAGRDSARGAGRGVPERAADAAVVEAVVASWQRAFDDERVGPDSDFFEAGGDSLVAVALVTDLGAALGIEVPIATLLTGRTPSGMATGLIRQGLVAARPHSDTGESSSSAPFVATQSPAAVASAASTATTASTASMAGPRIGADGVLDGTPPDGSGPDRADSAGAHPDGAVSDEFAVVTMRSGTPDGPLVVLTPAWDDIFGYQALAASFPAEVTVLAAAYHELPGRPVVGTVADLVDEFLPRLAPSVGARDRVAVVGWSIGGAVTVELADRLNDAGHLVDVAVLVDTFFPGEDRHRWSNRWWKYKSLLRPGTIGEAGREFTKMGRRRLQRYAAKLGRRLLAWSGTPLPAEPARTSITGFPVTALQHEVVRVATPLLLFSANTTNPRRTVDKWSAVADRITVVPVEGRHRGLDSVMEAGRTDVLAAAIVAALADARR